MKRYLYIIAAIAALWATPATPAPIPWKLPEYTLVARDMDLRMALDTFAVAEGLSVVMSDSVVGLFSGDFRNVKPDEFLARIATTHNLIWYYDGAALYLYGAGEIATLLIDLKYMKAGEVRLMLTELGVEDERFPLKTTSNDELVMVAGPPRYVQLVAELVVKADSLREKRTFNEVEARLFPLTYTWADDVSFSVTSPESTLTIRGVASLLRDMMSSGSAGITHEAVLTNETDSIDVQRTSAFTPVIKAENRLNAVLVRDVVSRMDMYEAIIKQLDVPQKLVEIDVTVVELSREDALDWQLSLALTTSHGHSNYGVGQNAANAFSPEDLAGQGLAGALTHIHSSYALGASLTALKSKGKARSISRTSLLTVNNLAAELTDTQSYHARVVGTEVATLQEVTAGTKLQVKPRILPSPSTNVPNQVWMSLALDDGGFETITVDAMPMSRKSTLQTQTAVYESESIMLAGYLRDIVEDGGWGIPWLRDIPFIGWLFGGKSVHKETVQRMFILTPHIVDINQESIARMQSMRLRDVTEAEVIEDDAEASDRERKRRDLERKYRQMKLHGESEDAYRRRKAELRHEKEMNDLEREKIKYRLGEDVKEWKKVEETAAEKLQNEIQAEEDAKAAAEEAAKKAAAEEEAKKTAAAEEPKAPEELKAPEVEVEVEI